MGTSVTACLETSPRQRRGAEACSAIVPEMHAKSDIGATSTGPSDSRFKEMLQAIARQDRRSFEEFYDLTSDRAMSLVMRITQSINVAEEVVSDVYLQVWRQADRFDPLRGNALAWLTVLCRSRALDTVRRNNTAPTSHAISISEIPEGATEELAQDLLIAIEQKTAVHQALEKLDPEHRQLLALAYFRGYSHSELAEFTGMPIGTVKTRLRRTVQKMKELVVAIEKEIGC